MLQLLLWIALLPQSTNQSLQETLEWLATKAPDLSAYTGKAGTGPIKTKITEFKAESCNATILLQRETANIATTYEYRFPLSAVDPAAIEVRPKDDGFTVRLAGRSGKSVISVRQVSSTADRMPNGQGLDASLEFFAESKESAARLTKAFQHAVKLCSEKKEPF